MLYEHERERELPVREPSLAEMTSSAIEMLQKGKDGFFLMVEGAKIDMGHHDGKVTTVIIIFTNLPSIGSIEVNSNLFLNQPIFGRPRIVRKSGFHVRHFLDVLDW